MTNNPDILNQSMFYGASPSVFEKAKYLRNDLTKAEEVLWEKLKNKQLGVKFRRQHPIYIYIADFYCHEKKIVIEVDGDYHLKSDQREQDEYRAEYISDFGIEVIRFTNEQVLEEMDEVIEKLNSIIASRTPQPLKGRPDTQYERKIVR